MHEKIVIAKAKATKGQANDSQSTLQTDGHALVMIQRQVLTEAFAYEAVKTGP